VAVDELLFVIVTVDPAKKDKPGVPGLFDETVNTLMAKPLTVPVKVVVPPEPLFATSTPGDEAPAQISWSALAGWAAKKTTATKAKTIGANLASRTVIGRAFLANNDVRVQGRMPSLLWIEELSLLTSNFHSSDEFKHSCHFASLRYKASYVELVFCPSYTSRPKSANLR
jgi:hypothetical protein